MRSLENWLAWLETLHPQVMELGLERISVVRDRLGLTPLPFTVVTVTGTNGKGSTVAMLEQCLHAAGYRVGAYTSPHFIDYNERVRIATEAVLDEELCAAFERVEAAREDTSLTYFEFGTLAAIELFRANEIDIAILEVGLGGRLDAVNAWDAEVAIVSSIGIDHSEWLGPDRESIGAEKAGIFRFHHYAICGDPQPPHSLIKVAEQVGARLLRVHRDFDFERLAEGWTWRSMERIHAGLPYPAMRGDYQLYNAASVIMALECLTEHFPVTEADLRAGLLKAVLPGRFQTLPGRPLRVLDVAHNVQAAQALAHTLATQTVSGRTLAVCGMLQDKPIVEVLRVLRPQVSHWYVAGLPGVRGTSTEDMRAALAAAGVHHEVDLHEDIPQAYAAALAEADDNDRILVFGSFHTVGAILRALKNRTGVMAERRSAEDNFNPRHRIVGAVVLVALAVIFLPMFLSDHPSDPPQVNPLGSGASDNKVVEVPVPSLDAAPGSNPTATKSNSQSTKAATESNVAVSDPVTPAPAVVASKPAPKSEPVAKTSKASSMPSAGGALMVQVGAFSQLENAKHLQAQLKQKGYSAKLDPAVPVKGKTIRVEVGPFKNPEAAQSAQSRIQNELGIKGVVRKP